MYIIDKTNRAHRGTNSRAYDFQELAKEARTNPDPGARKAAVIAMDQLKKESKDVTSMREALIKAHRQGNQSEIKDIQDIVKSKKKYQHEK